MLSENAGAHEELRGTVLSINPFDVEATALALYTARSARRCRTFATSATELRLES